MFPLEGPNGIGLSPDETTLYVAETPTGRLWAYALSAPGQIDQSQRPKMMAQLPDYHMFDSLAVDVEGNVWYFGEHTLEYEEGELVGIEGSWEAGEDGALPGIIMKADPQVDDFYRQELLVGEAEDAGGVLSLTESVTVPARIPAGHSAIPGTRTPPS